MSKSKPVAPDRSSPEAAVPCVLLLHGLGRSPCSMRPLQRTLARCGFAAHNQGYPSRRYPFEELYRRLLEPMLELATAQRPLHVVTHSMGGILLRRFLQDHDLPAGSRVVMLAPPNQGSEVCDRYRQHAWYRFVTGPAGQSLGTEAGGLPKRLGPITTSRTDVGVIAGNRSSDPWFNRVFSGPHDGKVSVASTRLEGMRDFLVVPAGHTFLMRHPLVQRAVVHFLRHGRFTELASTPKPGAPQQSGT